MSAKALLIELLNAINRNEMLIGHRMKCSYAAFLSFFYAFLLAAFSRMIFHLAESDIFFCAEKNKNLRKWVGNKEDSVVEASWKSSFSSYFTTMGVQGTNDKM